MKKIFFILTALLMIAALASCGKTAEKTKESTSVNTAGETSDEVISEYYESIASTENGETLFTPDRPYEKSKNLELISVTSYMEEGSYGSVVFKGFANVQYTVSVYDGEGKKVRFTESDLVSADENGRAVYTFQMPFDSVGTYALMFRQNGGDSYLQTLVTVVK